METRCVELPLSFLSSRVLHPILAKCFVLSVIALLNFNTHIIAVNTPYGGNDTDRLALLAFKSKIIHDPQCILRSWNDSLHFCEWEGVSCGRKHRRVTILDLSSKVLMGSLSPDIGNISFLREIRLQDNTLQGEIPPEVGRLLRLQVLHLGHNSLEGKIPSNLSQCSNLVFLYLAGNKLGGKIPVELASLSKLIELYFHQNFLTGGIPPFVGNLTSLETLSARTNILGGTIPNALGQLKNILRLGLGENNLSGMIPLSIYNLSSIIIFSVSKNNLHGSLPKDVGLSLPFLEFLQICGNYFNGSIPVSLSNASSLQLFDLGDNNFTGKVEIHFGNMQQLSYLQLSSNILEGGKDDELKFLTSLGNCSNLERLYLDGNRFEGVLPNSFANLSSQLKALSIARNRFSGELPYGIGNLVNLTILEMQNNHFSGTIPTDFGQLQKLQRLHLSYNIFSREIPPSLGNLTLLSELYLDHNQLHGPIPSSLGSCQQLLLLNLSHNNLSGIIPKHLFAIVHMSISLNLAQNQLLGPLPSEIGNLFNLNELDVSHNNLSGKIPSYLGGCRSLVSLYLESNNFQGPIPPSLASLHGLDKFDVSRNNLSGKIPEYLDTFNFSYLNFSFNNFEGEVPIKGVFANASAVSVGGNNKLCGGISELHLPKCITKSKRNKFSLAKIGVPAVCAFFVVVIASSFALCWIKRKKQNISLSFSRKFSTWNLSYESLFKATNGFSSTNLVGMGSTGSVYKGILDEDEAIIAVKVLNIQQHGFSKSFMAECKALRSTRHRNLVKLITCCSSIDFQGNDFKALVYEFMPNGSLEKWLHPVSKINNQPTQHQSLSLLQRINIAIDIANALDYLHHHCPNLIVHCDLKPSNVLLDNDMVAHVGDFGLARFQTQFTNPNQSSSIGVRGTIGYTPPEYGLGNLVSTFGDVYSYGILLLEMMTRKKPTDSLFREGLNLHKFARMAVPDQVPVIVDPLLLNDDGTTANTNLKECLISLINIGVACTMDSPEYRMDIHNVVKELQSIRKILL